MDLLILSGHSSGLGRALLEASRAGEAGVPLAFLGIARRLLQLKGPLQRECSIDLGVDSPWEAELEAALSSLPGKFQRIFLINNAGRVDPVAPLAQLSAASIQAALQLNVLAPFRLCRYVLERFPQQSIRIANISSGAASKAYEGWSLYCSSKASLRMMSEVLGLEMQTAGRDVRVLSFAPGVIDTPMQTQLRGLSAADFPAVERFRALHREGQLVAPQAAAQALLARLQDPELPYFADERFQPTAR